MNTQFLAVAPRPHMGGKGLGARLGFSLVEVVVAIAIISFAMTAVVGLIPIGLSSMRDSVDDSMTGPLVRSVRERLVGEPFTAGDLDPFYYDHQGLYLGDTASEQSHYRVDVSLENLDSPLPHSDMLLAVVRIGWPVGADGTAPVQYRSSFYVSPMSGTGWQDLDPNHVPKIGL